ncbi:MAG: hypothetical protein AB8H80_11545 [Planctomycetota bacterium]
MVHDSGLDDDAMDPLGNDERDLLVVLKLSDRKTGTGGEQRRIEALADRLHEALQEAGVGECDGDEYGGGEATLFFCGPDEDAMLGVLRPLLQRDPMARGASFVRLVEDADGEMRREAIRV